MAGALAFILLTSTILQCATSQTLSSLSTNDILGNNEANAVVVSNSTVKDPGIDKGIGTTAIPQEITNNSLDQPQVNISSADGDIKEGSNESKLLSTLLKQAAFESLLPDNSNPSSSSLSPVSEVPEIPTTINPTHSPVPTTISTIPKSIPEQSNTEATRPDSCSGRKPHQIQPVQDELSMIRKCCPVGESFYNDNLSEQPAGCVENDQTFALKPIAITLYEDCIEDNETAIEMELSVGNLCNRSVYYSESLDDQMYVIQNGSLLVMDTDGAIGFSIFNDYCIDINAKTGKYDAIVCVAPPVPVHIGKGQTILYTTLMIISIPCLFFVTFIHYVIDKLNHLHGLCIGSMAFCLGVGFLLHSISQISVMAEMRLQYAVQYFILAYYMWIFILCLNLVLFLWIYVIRYVNLRRRHTNAHFFIYFIIAMVLPIFLVVYTKVKRIPGMPSYFQQAWSESIKTGQRYFIPPVSAILGICFILLVIAFFGFRKLDEILSDRESVSYHLVVNGDVRTDTLLPKIDRSFADQVQLNARCLALLYVLVVFTWILEVVTFYSPGAGDYLMFLESMNALQGVFILIIFVIIRKKRKVIASWWIDRGSHTISETTGTEMRTMNKKMAAEKNPDDIEMSG